MIPKTFHRIWLGPAPIPDDAERYWRKFQQLHPGWKFRTWTDRDDYAFVRNADLVDAAKTWTSRSDVLRFEILHRFGGIYVDVDVEPLKPFAPLLGEGAFAGFESPRIVCGAVLGSSPRHPAMDALVTTLPGWVTGRSMDEPAMWAGPGFLSAQWISRLDVTLHDRHAFYPIHWRHVSRQATTVRTYNGSYCIHWWKKRWDAA